LVAAWVVCGAVLPAGCSSPQTAESGPAQGPDGGDPSGGAICVSGRITDEGVECPTLRSQDGSLYSLAGDLGEFEVGDEVCVCGPSGGFSICMQGTTIAVHRMTEPKAGCPD
jgi:hypothetical protein